MTAGVTLGLTAATLSLGITSPAAANPAGTGLVISEVYGGGGNSGATFTHDFVELYNPTAGPLSLAGLSVQYRSTGGGVPNGVSPVALSGTLAAGDHYLVQMASNAPVGAPLPTPDATGTYAMAGGSGQALLVNGTAPFTGSGNVAGNAGLVDMVGYGTGNNTFESATEGTALTSTTSAQRAANGADTDNNPADFTPGAPTPTNSEAGAPADLAAVSPGNKTSVVNRAITPFTLEATGGTAPYAWTATGLPTGLTISTDGTVSGTPTATGTSNVTARVTDDADPEVSAATTFDYVVTEPGAVTPIAAIQGDGAASPVAGTTVTTEGVVTASYPTGGFDGFYLQTGGTGGATDATPGRSDGVFVYAPSVADADYPAIGDSVEVSGPVTESFTQTQITAAAADIVAETPALAPVTPLAEAYPTTETAREAHEGELLAPTDEFTVSNTFGSNTFGEIGLATGDTPLLQPTDVVDFQTGNPGAVTADNLARGVVLDDGASINYSPNGNTVGGNKNIPLPWQSTEAPIRVGATATLTGPVVLKYDFGFWRFQPTDQVTDRGTDVATFENTRTDAPEDVGGDARLATFNVLNYFPTTGQEYVASGLGTCSYFNDRAGVPITNQTCTNNGPRGAATTASFERQEAKIVSAISALDASVVSLEEIENSVQFGKDRDFAVSTLVDALNEDAESDIWEFVPSPAAADLPTPAQEDVIRTAFIYKPAEVTPVGDSEVLIDETNFDNAREPLAQAFKAVGAPDVEAFGVIVNHFKSKGGTGTGGNADTGQGSFNADRIGQANALSAFADTFAADRGIEAMFLAGDFNSYTQEDPLQELYADGYTNLESDTEGEVTYSFSGLSGSLDHVLANEAALALVNGVDIWNINSPESLAFEYSRFNNNVTDFYQDGPFKASDHDPEVIGLMLGEEPEPATREIQILATNDFHGRLQNSTANGEAGAATLAGAVKQLRTANPDTVFAAAGDLIGASTFESFIQDDKPTIDALNEAGLDVSAVGNHELDKGYDDLINRVMAPESADNPNGGAEWAYISANLKIRATGDDAVPATFIKSFGSVDVGFVGAVTEDLPQLVSPSGIADLEVTDIVESVNEEATLLEDNGADVIVLLVHEGATTTAITSATDDSAFGQIVNGVNEDVDAIVSGHTHLAYNHSIPVDEWLTDASRPVKERPVVSAGQYGTNLNQLVFTVDTATGVVTSKTQAVLALKTGQTANYPADPATAQIVSEAVAEGDRLGAVKVGEIEAPFNRAKLSNGTTENRGGESTLGNLVAEVQQWATEGDETGSSQIAFMNPGGLRADLTGTVNGAVRDVTFKQAANVQPFANTLVNMRLTGAQIETVLEQQWQAPGASRPFLRLGISEGFTYTYVPPAAGAPSGTKGEVTAMYLDGELVDDASTYSVTVNSFLASGGDGFTELNNGASKRDTGKSDLQAQVDFFEARAAEGPLPVDYSQRSVGVTFPTAAPAEYQPGDTVAFDLSSLSMTAPGDLRDATVEVSLGDTDLGSFPVTTTVGDAVFDEVGTASVSFALPAGLPAGDQVLTVRGPTTGTVAEVPVTIAAAEPVPSTVTGNDTTFAYGQMGTVELSVTGEGDVDPTGTVELYDGDTLLGSTELVDGAGEIDIESLTLEPGTYELTLVYSGDSVYEPSEGSVTVTVTKAESVISASANPATVEVLKGRTTVRVFATASGYVPTGTVDVFRGTELLGSGELDRGVAAISLPVFDTVGDVPLSVRYRGDDLSEGDDVTTGVAVVKQEPTVSVIRPAEVKKGGTPLIRVTVRATGTQATGQVSASFNGKSVTGRLVDGKVALRLPAMNAVGNTQVTVRYAGNDLLTAASETRTIKVVKR